MPSPPPAFIVHCPRCGEVVRLHDEIPDFFPRPGWTDGKDMHWDLVPKARWRPDELYRGYSCGKLFWTSETIPLSGRTRAMPAGVVAKDRDQLLRALETDAAIGAGRQVWIRSRILWLDNDPVRAVLDPRSSSVQIVRASVTYSPAFKTNADKLLLLLNFDDARERLLMADLLRQCGFFKEAVAALKSTAELFFETQEREVTEEREYNEQFRTARSEGVVDLRPRVESLILLARFIIERALDRDPLVRPFRRQKRSFGEADSQGARPRL